MRGISWLNENRLASQEGLCSMEYYGHVSILKFGILELLEHSGLFMRAQLMLYTYIRNMIRYLLRCVWGECWKNNKINCYGVSEEDVAT